jgi:heterotetrameric sarcosine oxidase gamma subunit
VADANNYLASIDGPELQVEFQPQWHAASLRHFERDGAFVGLVHDVTGLSVPNDLGAVCGGNVANGAVTVLAWRGPTETTLLTRDETVLESLQRAAAELSDGCLVDQRGGLLVMRARGDSVAALVARKAGHGAMPAIGEARRARFAEVPVLIIKLRAEETLLVVDRVYAPHVMASIRVSARDLHAPAQD